MDYKSFGISNVIERVRGKAYGGSAGSSGDIKDLVQELLNRYKGDYVIVDKKFWPYVNDSFRMPIPQVDVFQNIESAEKITEYLNKENPLKHYTPIKINENEPSLKKVVECQKEEKPQIKRYTPRKYFEN